MEDIACQFYGMPLAIAVDVVVGSRGGVGYLGS